MSTHNLCFEAKVGEIGIPLYTPGIPLYTPVLLHKSEVKLKGYTFHGHVILMILTDAFANC